MFLNICFFYPRKKKVIYVIIYILYTYIFTYLYIIIFIITVFIRSSPSFFELTYMLLQNNCINNGIKERKKASKQLYMVKQKKGERDGR